LSTIPLMSTKRTTTSQLKPLNTKMTMTWRWKVFAWDRHKNVAGLNRLMGSQHSLYNITYKLLICGICLFYIPPQKNLCIFFAKWSSLCFIDGPL